MAVGKNKKLGKKRKGGNRKVVDPFSKKEWSVTNANDCGRARLHSMQSTQCKFSAPATLMNFARWVEALGD
jgi:hypothetical protein